MTVEWKQDLWRAEREREREKNWKCNWWWISIRKDLTLGNGNIRWQAFLIFFFFLISEVDRFFFRAIFLLINGISIARRKKKVLDNLLWKLLFLLMHYYCLFNNLIKPRVLTSLITRKEKHIRTSSSWMKNELIYSTKISSSKSLRRRIEGLEENESDYIVRDSLEH